MHKMGSSSVLKMSLKLLKTHRLIIDSAERYLIRNNRLSTSSSDLFKLTPSPGGKETEVDLRKGTTTDLKKGAKDHEVGPTLDSLSEKKTSFAKNLFLGRFDTDVLTFPEVLDKEKHDTLHEMLEPIERFYRDEVDSKKIDVEGKIPDKVLNGLKELGLYGQQVPLEYGGLGLGATEYARLQEIVSLDGGIAVTMAAHQAIGYKGILLYGTEEQKQKYLPGLAAGEMLAAFALTEPGSGSDAGSVTTKATQSKDGKTWVLNGSKIWISNGGTADFFTVFARTAGDDVTDKSSKKMTAFLVERKFGGVTNGKAEDKLGIRGSNTTEVYFENTPVPVENVLGEVGDGFKVAVNILNSGRFSMGSAVAGSMKVLMGVAAEFASSRKQFGKPLSEFGLIQEKFARTAMQTYAMESMAYMTAGMLDSNQYENCAVEAAIVKVYSSESAWTSASELLQVFGGSGYMKDLPFERYLRDSRILLIFEGTNEILRLFIALTGLQHAGKELRDMVKKLRQPFKNPNFVFKKMSQRWRQERDNPTLNLGLTSFLHPTLKDSAELLEYTVLRLQYAVEMVLQRHGAKVTEPGAQLELKRLADTIIDIYMMTCVLSRASRSYCIGIKHSESEVQLAKAICIEAHKRCRIRNEEIINADLLWDDMLMDIAKTMFKEKGYFAQHPLTKTFW